MPIKYMGQCSEHKASFVPNICSEVELFRTYKLPCHNPIKGIDFSTKQAVGACQQLC